MTRHLKFSVGEYYHIFNRGTEKRKIFLDKQDLYYFLDNLTIANRVGTKGTGEKEYKSSKGDENLVKIVAFALLPNHFHLLLNENIPGGISKFMQKLITSYVMYFNKKYKRSGVLFQGKFKAKTVADLTGISAYVNLNYLHHKYRVKKDLFKTSYFEYVDPANVKEFVCNKKEVKRILQISGGLKGYKKDAMQWAKVFKESHEKGYED